MEINMTINNPTIEPVLVSVVDKTSPSLVRGTPQAAGLDIKACIQGSESIKPDEVKMIKTGLRMALPNGSFGMIVPRSGLGTKHGIVLANSVGIIDSDYRGEILVPLKNTSNTTFTVEPDMRIAQMIILEHKSDCCFVEISEDEMNNDHVSERSVGGFGSTGVN
tara:strand:+ start:3242 stop:3733 length:492 start_codon:yes stop_codon:yes gene_type:complete